jgi:hypothetical protein
MKSVGAVRLGIETLHQKGKRPPPVSVREFHVMLDAGIRIAGA